MVLISSNNYTVEVTMTITYADITVGSVVDGEVITEAERWSVAPAIKGTNARDWSRPQKFIRFTTNTGGRRTEAANGDASGMRVQHIADPTLADVAQAALEDNANHYAGWLRNNATHRRNPIGAVAGTRRKTMDMLHGMALEMNRRRALDCIARRCVCHGAGR